LHGANRLGGNSLAEILIFGRRAGLAAADRSIDMVVQQRSRQVIKKAHDKIDSFIKNGSDVARPLQRELRNIMWEHCGVVRKEEKLQMGIQKINQLKDTLKHLDVRPDSEGFEDLMLAFDLEGSIMSAEATVLGAIARKESRGAHQRSDYSKTISQHGKNYISRLNMNGDLEIHPKRLEPLTAELKSLIENTSEINDFEGMLLE